MMPVHDSVAIGGNIQACHPSLAFFQGCQYLELLTPLAVTKHLLVQPLISARRGLHVLFFWSAKAVHAAIDLRDNITCFQVYEAINSPAY